MRPPNRVVDVCLFCECSVLQTATLRQDAGFLARLDRTGLRHASFADAQPVLMVNEFLSNTAARAETIEARLTFADLDPVSVLYDPAGLSQFESLRFGMPVDASSVATGRHSWQIEIIEHYASSPDVSGSASGEYEILNWSDSAFGKGWSLAYLDRLVVQEDGESAGGLAQVVRRAEETPRKCDAGQEFGALAIGP